MTGYEGKVHFYKNITGPLSGDVFAALEQSTGFIPIPKNAVAIGSSENIKVDFNEEKNTEIEMLLDEIAEANDDHGKFLELMTNKIEKLLGEI
tara:strand:- start:767 stop:1045 length:279 start_codon:yes stop_codon:yes gene_type:complete